MTKHAHLIYNPYAGAAVSPELWLGRIVHALCAAGYEVSTIATRAELDSNSIVEILMQGTDMLVAAGGDGTIRLALEASAMSGKHIPVGVIPLGTGNLLARNLDLYDENLLFDPLDKALKTLIDGKILKMDMGKMNGHFFAVAAGVGPMSDAILTPERHDKVNWRMLAYASSLVQTIAQPPTLFKVTMNGESAITVGASGLFVTNIADLGLGALSESARMDDGVLDLCVLAPQEFQDYLEMGFRFIGGVGGDHTAYYMKKVTSVDIEVLPVSRQTSVLQKSWRRIKQSFGVYEKPPLLTYSEVTAMIDGDSCGTTPMHIEVAPHAVSVKVPKSYRENN